MSARFRGEIRLARSRDLPAIVEIYNQGVEDRTATCDLSGLTPDGRRAWFEQHTHPYGIWVAVLHGQVTGWVSLSRYDPKPCFHRTGTFSTYVDRGHRGQGIGGALRRRMIDEATRRGFHTLVNRVFGLNDASVALARRYGFEQVGHMRELVYRDGEYVDCVFFQLMLPRGREPDSEDEDGRMEHQPAAAAARPDR